MTRSILIRACCGARFWSSGTYFRQFQRPRLRTRNLMWEKAWMGRRRRPGPNIASRSECTGTATKVSTRIQRFDGLTCRVVRISPRSFSRPLQLLYKRSGSSSPERLRRSHTVGFSPWGLSRDYGLIEGTGRSVCVHSSRVRDAEMYFHRLTGSGTCVLIIFVAIFASVGISLRAVIAVSAFLARAYRLHCGGARRTATFLLLKR